MPPTRIDYVDQPLVMRRYTPDLARLAALYQRQGEDVAAIALRKGAVTADTLERLGGLFSGYQQAKQRERDVAEARAVRQSELQAADQFRRDQLAQQAEIAASQMAERQAAAQAVAAQKADAERIRQEGETRKAFESSIEGLSGVVPSDVYQQAQKLGLGAKFRVLDGAPVLLETSAMRDRREDNVRQKERDTADAEYRAKDLAIREQAANRPASSPVPVVVMTPSGPALVDRTTGTAAPVIGADGKPVGLTPSATERMDARKFSKAAPVLASIGELSERINTNQGVYAKMAGGVAKQKAKLNLDDDVAEYDALVSGFTPLVARALGHTGVLTEQDVQSVKAIFPKPGDSKTLRDRKMQRLMGLVGQLEGASGISASPSPDGPRPTVKVLKIEPVK